MASPNPVLQLIEWLTPLVQPLGYEIVHIEIQTQRQKVLRLFIDKEGGIGVEDCAIVSRALDEPLEKMTEIDAIFKGGYELEVSSPGIDRPLRLSKDFEKFAGQPVRIHVFRPLTAEELNQEDYQKKNPKQKNFQGVLQGIQNEKVLLALDKTQVTIPLELISKANLEPKLNFNDSNERNRP